jgi:hypothetical protein
MSWIRYWLKCLAWWWSQERPLGPKAKLYETTHAGWKQVSLAEWAKMYEPAQYMDRAVDALAEENAILNGEPVPDASPCECLETEVIDDDDGLRRQCKRCGAYEMLDRELHELAAPMCDHRMTTVHGTSGQPPSAKDGLPWNVAQLPAGGRRAMVGGRHQGVGARGRCAVPSHEMEARDRCVGADG